MDVSKLHREEINRLRSVDEQHKKAINELESASKQHADLLSKNESLIDKLQVDLQALSDK